MLKKIARDFSGLFKTASNFAHANLKLEKVNISVSRSFLTIRSSCSAPQGITGKKKNFEISYHNAITDTVLSSMRASRFPALTQRGFLKS